MMVLVRGLSCLCFSFIHIFRKSGNDDVVDISDDDFDDIDDNIDDKKNEGDDDGFEKN